MIMTDYTAVITWWAGAFEHRRTSKAWKCMSTKQCHTVQQVYGDLITLDIWNVTLWKTRFQTFKDCDLQEDVLLGKHLSMKQKHYFSRHILAFLSILTRTLTVTSSRLLSLSLSLILHPFLPHHLILLFFAVPFQYHSCSLYPFSITFSLPSLSLRPFHPFFFFFF